MSLTPGTRLGAYEITGPIGAGGMGEVYRADDARLGRTVAIKVLPRHLATADRLERFEQEARAASALNHPNILTIHDVGRDGDSAWFAMEFVDGPTLRDLLEGADSAQARARLCAADRGGTRQSACRRHHPSRPQAGECDGDRRRLAKIVDFGIAKAGNGPAALPVGAGLTVTAPAGTTPGVVVGTIGYMSPEQASGRPVDYRTDQFALGLLIYELVTRTRPFERPTAAQSIAATIEAEPPPIAALNPDVPPHLADIVARLLAKDPAERYDSTRDLARDLRTVLEGLSRRTPAGPAGIDEGTPRRRRGRGRSRFAAAAVLVLVIAAAVGWLWRPGAAVPVEQTAAEPDRPLIAVRPFRSLSADPQQGYFAAGMTEEIRGQLSRVPALRILSGTGLDGYEDDLPRALCARQRQQPLQEAQSCGGADARTRRLRDAAAGSADTRGGGDRPPDRRVPVRHHVTFTRLGREREGGKRVGHDVQPDSTTPIAAASVTSNTTTATAAAAHRSSTTTLRS